MPKNIATKTYALDYYGLLNFQIIANANPESAHFLALHYKNLSPFLRLEPGICVDPNYTISLSFGVPDLPPMDTWQRVTFFNPLTDNAIPDFGEGLIKVYSAKERSIYNPKSGSLINIHENKIHLSYKSELSFNKDFQRILKQLLVTEIENMGGAIIHASAFAYRDKAICFIGEKGQGKTTSLLQALAIPETKYLTNDRMPIIPSGDHFEVYGWFEELRLIVPGSEKKKVVDVLSVIPAARVQVAPAKLRKIIFPATKPLHLSFDTALETQLLSPLDEQRPKWLGYSDPKPFPNNRLLHTVDKCSISWSYSDLPALTAKIQEVLIEA